MIKSRASSLSAIGSALLVASLVAACGSSSKTSSFDKPGGSSSSGGGSGSSSGSSGDDDDSNTDGGTSPILNHQDAGQPTFEDAGCAQATATTSRQPVYIEFVLDGSGSMGQDNKWTAATAAIEGVFSSMVSAADDGVGAGLLVFSDSKDKTSGNGPYPESTVDVPIAFVDSAQDGKFTTRLSGKPSNGTPTGSAMTGGYGVLTSFTPSAPLLPGGKKVMVLITDGVPTDQCSTNGDGSDNYAQNACPVMAGTQLASGVETFVIGVGTVPTSDFGNFDPYFLAQLAISGGSSLAGCNAKENTANATDFCYFEVDPSGSSAATQTAFENALNAIRGQIASCTFQLNSTDAGTVDPGKVNVTVNGSPIFQDPKDGWSFGDPSDTSITLNGAACNTVKTTPNSTVSIVLGCTTQVPPPVQ